MRKTMKVYFIVLALVAFGNALTNDIFSNYFKEVYQVTALQRGMIEIPRESPGMLMILFVAGLSFLSDIKISILAQILSVIGITVLGFFTPTFGVMLIFIFINSLGMHLFMPMSDSIGLSLSEPEKIGKRMGQYKGITTAFQMVGTALVFVGFSTGFFSFDTQIKWVFLISAVIFLIVIIVLLILNKLLHNDGKHPRKVAFVLRKEYKYYYTLVVMYGVQKQMMMVYGPWVLIELLGAKTQTIALLGMVGLFIGIFFIPALGRWIDRFGVKKLLYADALSFILVYFAYGFLSAGYVNGSIAVTGIPVLLAYILFISDRMSSQMGIIRTVYLKKIAVDHQDITPTLSLGLSLDHVMSILFAVIGGFVWDIYGPQYIFYLVGALSFVNLFVAFIIKEDF